MVQGTGSSVGKSLIATALCRIFRQDGFEVAPFKAQNMSLNSFVTPGGAEIGRSQAVQAQAAGVLPTADMNPVLLKPEADHRSQVVLLGRPAGRTVSKEFGRRRPGLWEVIAASLDRLRSEYEIVVIEGAGSPAEINLREGDVANMEVALHARAPVLLVGDIDRGGVFASLYGTLELIAPEERGLVFGVVINRFRGDASILRPGLDAFESLSDVPVLGVVPHFDDIHMPEEDSPSGKPTRRSDAVLDVAVIALPHISNFDDFDPLEREAGVGVRYVRRAAELGRPDLAVIPGTKTTMADLQALRDAGTADALAALAADGTPMIGICGGFQMLGRRILDPDRVESDRPHATGLGLLPVETRFRAGKETHQARGVVLEGRGLLAGAAGIGFEGYEIHSGVSAGVAGAGALSLTRLTDGSTAFDGCLSADGLVFGCYVHGLFHNDELRRAILRNLAARKGESLPDGGPPFSQAAEYDRLAALVRDSLDLNAVYRAMSLPRPAHQT